MTNFMRPDEFIILMDMQTVPAPYEAMLRLRQAGMQTVYQFVDWAAIEPAPGQYDWAALDARVNQARRAGMKTLLATPNTVPAWCPDEWRIAMEGGQPVREYIDWRLWPALSPWHFEAAEAQLGFIWAVMEHYGAAGADVRDDAPDVLVIASHTCAGEAFLPPYGPAYYDEFALANYRLTFGSGAMPDSATEETQTWLRAAMVQSTLDIQLMCATQAGGLWCQLHRYHERYPWTGNLHVGTVYEVLAGIGQPVNALQFTHFPLGPDQFERVARDRAAFPAFDFWVGAEYAEGLAVHAPAAIAQGLRGLICAPLHPYQGHREVEGWMVDAVAKAHRLFEGAGR